MEACDREEQIVGLSGGQTKPPYHAGGGGVCELVTERFKLLGFLVDKLNLHIMQVVGGYMSL